eukprot:sb/3461874/
MFTLFKHAGAQIGGSVGSHFRENKRATIFVLFGPKIVDFLHYGAHNEEVLPELPFCNPVRKWGECQVTPASYVQTNIVLILFCEKANVLTTVLTRNENRVSLPVSGRNTAQRGITTLTDYLKMKFALLFTGLLGLATATILLICAITPVCICITRPARGELFPHIGPLRSNGTICNISPRTQQCCHLAVLATQRNNIVVPRYYMCYNTGVYLYNAPREGRVIPAYWPVAEQRDNMQYITPNATITVTVRTEGHYSYSGTEDNINITIYGASNDVNFSLGSSFPKSSFKTVTFETDLKLGNVHCIDLQTDGEDWWWPRTITIQVFSSQLFGLISLLLLSLFLSLSLCFSNPLWIADSVPLMWMCQQGYKTCTVTAETSTADWANSDGVVIMATIYGKKGATMTGIFDNDDINDLEKSVGYDTLKNYHDFRHYAIWSTLCECSCNTTYMCYNTGVYLYNAPREGRVIPAYWPVAEQRDNMQYITPNAKNMSLEMFTLFKHAGAQIGGSVGSHFRENKRATIFVLFGPKIVDFLHYGAHNEEVLPELPFCNPVRKWGECQVTPASYVQTNIVLILFCEKANVLTTVLTRNENRILLICAITPVCICITRPARGELFPHIGPLRSNGTICNISPRTQQCCHLAVLATQRNNIVVPRYYMCYNTGVYLYNAPREGRVIPAYWPVAEQRDNMQYITPNATITVTVRTEGHYSYSGTEDNINITIYGASNDVNFSLGSSFPKSSFKTVTFETDLKLGNVHCIDLQTDGEDWWWPRTITIQVFSSQLFGLISLLLLSLFLSLSLCFSNPLWIADSVPLMWMCQQGYKTCTVTAETSTADWANSDGVVIMATIYGKKGATMTGIFDNDDINDLEKSVGYDTLKNYHDFRHYAIWSTLCECSCSQLDQL